MAGYDVTQRTTAAPEVVWRRLADVGGWARWGPWHETGLESPGPDGGGGVGAVRRLRRGRVVSRELVTELDAPNRLGYRLLSGLPLRDYAATVTLTPSEGGTVIHWRSQFRPALPGTGWFWSLFLGAFTRRVARMLAADAERGAAGESTAAPA